MFFHFQDLKLLPGKVPYRTAQSKKTKKFLIQVQDEEFLSLKYHKKKRRYNSKLVVTRNLNLVRYLIKLYFSIKKMSLNK
jgi:hypothetical protein